MNSTKWDIYGTKRSPKPMGTYRFWGWLYRFAVFRMPLSYFCRISVENITEVKVHMDMDSGRKKERETHRERERKLSIDTSALPFRFYCGSCSRALHLCTAKTIRKGIERRSAHLDHILIIQGYRFGINFQFMSSENKAEKRIISRAFV